MMLLLKKHARENNLRVRMINVDQAVLQAFEMVHLDKEFEINQAEQHH